MSDGIFSPEATAAQLQKLPQDEAHVGVVAKDGDVGVEAEGSRYIGKGWSGAATFAWMKQTGWAVVAGLNWKGKPKP